jgi:hypothetical protein
MVPDRGSSCSAAPDSAGRRPDATREVMGRRRPRATRLAVAVGIAVSLMAGCTAAVERPGAAAAPSTDLRGVCPNPIVIQAAWYPDVTHSYYELLGPGYRVDAKRATVTGALVAPDADGRTLRRTGVDIEIRSGGPVVGYRPADELMWRDPTITFGNQGTDEQLLAATRGRAVLSVFAPLDQDPVVFIWDRDEHPDFTVVNDIGVTDVPVITIDSDPSTQYLLQNGILRRSQLAPGFDGTPRPWLAAGGRGVLGGYLTKDIYLAQRLAPRRRLAYALLSDAGYPNYRTTITMRTADRPRLDGCLRRLVPIMQTAQAAFMRNPERQIRTVVDLNADYRAPYPYDRRTAEYGFDQITRNALVFAGRDGRIGDEDVLPNGRIARFIAALRPVYGAKHTPLPDDLQPGDLATNDYLAPIGLAPPRTPDHPQ